MLSNTNIFKVRIELVWKLLYKHVKSIKFLTEFNLLDNN